MGDPNPAPLDNIVEVDETYVGGKFGNMNRKRRKIMQDTGKDNKSAVMGFIERDGSARLRVIGDNTFKDVVRDNVKPSATVITDSHISYVGLADEYNDHQSVNHSIMEFRKGIAYTNSVEGFFACLKRSIFGIYHQVSPKHLQRYCYETAYRYNTRKITDKDRFNMTLQNVEGRLTYKSLINKTQEQ